jgi:hypothetical protein
MPEIKLPANPNKTCRPSKFKATETKLPIAGMNNTIKNTPHFAGAGSPERMIFKTPGVKALPQFGQASPEKSAGRFVWQWIQFI